MVEDNVIQSKPEVPEVPHEIAFGEARNIRDLWQCATRVVHEYAKLGYVEETLRTRLKILFHYYKNRSSVFFAKNKDGVVIATLSLSQDSFLGIETDKVFGEKVAELRSKSDAKIAEMGDFARDENVATNRTFLKLMVMAFMRAQKVGVHHLVITVTKTTKEITEEGVSRVVKDKKGHSSFYMDVLGFRALSEETRPHPKVKGVLAIGLVTTIEELLTNAFVNRQVRSV